MQQHMSSRCHRVLVLVETSISHCNSFVQLHFIYIQLSQTVEFLLHKTVNVHDALQSTQRFSRCHKELTIQNMRRKIMKRGKKK